MSAVNDADCFVMITCDAFSCGFGNYIIMMTVAQTVDALELLSSVNSTSVRRNLQ